MAMAATGAVAIRRVGGSSTLHRSLSALDLPPSSSSSLSMPSSSARSPPECNPLLIGRTFVSTSIATMRLRGTTPSSHQLKPQQQSQQHGGGNRVFLATNGIGSDSSMIAANDRCSALRPGGVVAVPSPAAILSSSPFAVAAVARGLASSSSSTYRESAATTATTALARLSTGAAQQPQEEGGGGMDDEYGKLDDAGHTYVHPVPFVLENGVVLPKAQLRYRTYGALNDAKDNVLVVCHALTGNASLDSWWGDLLGPGLAFDTSKYFVVCANILGSCYGSTSPKSPMPKSFRRSLMMSSSSSPSSSSSSTLSSNDEEEKKSEHGGATMEFDDDDDEEEQGIYGVDFPDVSVQDTVRLQLHMLKSDLKVHSVKCVIGGSFGGMQAVEFAVQGGTVGSDFAVNDENGRAEPFVRSVVPIACGAAHSAWQIGISEVQRQAIYADPKWNGGRPDPSNPPNAGLSVARQIGMISYRTSVGYEKKFSRKLQGDSGPAYGSKASWQVKSYLEYQGYKFLGRFDPVTYVKLTEQMDTHDIGRNRGGKEMALSNVRIPALVLGIDSDILYPLHEQEELVSLFPNAELKVIHSDAGHDGFLLEQEQVAAHITSFLSTHD